MSELKKNLGAGLLLNPQHLDSLLEPDTGVEWVELTSEHLLGIKANRYRPRVTTRIEQLLSMYPVSLHGLELSIGSADPTDAQYLKNLRELETIIQPKIISDHMVWTGAFGYHAHELIPFPYTEETLDHVSQKVSHVQDVLKRQFVLENPPSSILFEHSTFSEAEFMNALADRTGCGLLIDVCNLYVTTTNNELSAKSFLDTIKPEHVQQYHLAGYQVDTKNGNFLYDTHDRAIPQPVWDLFATALDKIGARTTNVEWIGDVNFGDLNEECQKIKAVLRNIERKQKLGTRAA